SGYVRNGHGRALLPRVVGAAVLLAQGRVDRVDRLHRPGSEDAAAAVDPRAGRLEAAVAPGRDHVDLLRAVVRVVRLPVERAGRPDADDAREVGRQLDDR